MWDRCRSRIRQWAMHRAFFVILCLQDGLWHKPHTLSHRPSPRIFFRIASGLACASFFHWVEMDRDGFVRLTSEGKVRTTQLRGLFLDIEV